MLVRMAYAHPERLRPVTNQRGDTFYERVPNHPTRPARPYEVNTWLEESPEPADSTAAPQ